MEDVQQSIFNFGLGEASREQLKKIAYWAGINAVLSLVSTGLSVIIFFKDMGTVRSSYLFMGANTQNGSSLFFQLLFALLLNITLYKSSVYLKKGIANSDQPELNKGLAQLRTYFKIFGILMILVIAIIIIAVLVIGAAKGF